jgi:predicted HTH domain antitoxin
MQITIDLPDSLLKELSFSLRDPEREVKFILAARLVESGRISTGRAAEWLGISKPRFLQEMARYGISALPVDEQSLEKDVLNAQHGAV